MLMLILTPWGSSIVRESIYVASGINSCLCANGAQWMHLLIGSRTNPSATTKQHTQDLRLTTDDAQSIDWNAKERGETS